METDTNTRLKNIEGSYQSLADSLGRIAGAVEEQGVTLNTIKISLMGSINDSTGIFSPGYIQKLDDITKEHQACMAKQNNRWKYVLAVCKDLLLLLLSAYVFYKFRAE